MTSTPFHAIVDARVNAVFGDLAPDRCSIEQNEHSDRERTWAVGPIAPSAAPVVIHADAAAEIADVIVGRDTQFEIPVTGGRYAADGLDEELELVLRLARDGGLTETCWIGRRGQIAKTVSRFKLGESPITLRRSHASVFAPARRRQAPVTYGPF